MISDVEIYVNNHQICFEEKDINMYSKARDFLHTTLILSLQLYLLSFLKQRYTFIKSARSSTSPKKTPTLRGYVFP